MAAPRRQPSPRQAGAPGPAAAAEV